MYLKMFHKIKKIFLKLCTRTRALITYLIDYPIAGVSLLYFLLQPLNILGVINPSFEFFLLLHFDGSLEQDILGSEEKYLKEEFYQYPFGSVSLNHFRELFSHLQNP